jgi:NAD+ kinase
MRLIIVANIAKPDVDPALQRLVPWLTDRAEIVAVETDHHVELDHTDTDAIIVLGGDGTLLSVARRLAGRAVPVMGFNFGRLGFLASFTPGELQLRIQQLIDGQLPVGQRMMLDARVVGVDAGPIDLTDRAAVERVSRFACLALNDAVLTAGPPFRMIELELGTDGDIGVRYFGDGLIVSTPSGSTAYNISAGGPILNPPLEAFCITPLCPHSLSFRPVVLSAGCSIMVVAKRVNAGTTLVCDGQSTTPLHAGDRVVIRKSDQNLLLVENPNARQWRTLAEKLHWASTPKYKSD